MKQFLVDCLLTTGQKKILDGRDFHYICRVRRSRVGDTLEIRDRTSALFEGTVIEIGEESCTLSIGNALNTDTRDYALHLYLCLCKGKKLDQMIRQATEAGVDSITLLNSQYSQIKLDREDREQSKYDRWRKIIKEACQQSGSRIQTRLDPVRGFQDLPSIRDRNSAGFFCHQEKLGSSRLSEIKESDTDEIHLVIGSEGGLSPAEIDILLKKGFSSLYLGNNVLRAETASIFAIGTIIATMELT